MRRRFKSSSRKSLRLPRLISVSLTTLLSLLATTATVRGAGPVSPDDSRLDASFRVMMSRVEADAAFMKGDAVKGDVAATAAAEALPATADQVMDLDSSLHLILQGNIDRGAVERLGYLVNTEAGGVMTVQGPLSGVGALLAMDGLRLLSATSPVHTMLDVSVDEIEAFAVWGGEAPFYTGTTGENVVVGIVDSGLDLTHADFRTLANLTRVKYAWDQTWTGTKPAGFNYGAEYTESMINAGLATSFRDTDGHGTHVAGIAAGNGRATGNGQPDYRYIGMAPEADLVVVKTNFTDAGIIDGVNYIFQRAALLGRPAVVNLSVGSQKGGHDGSNALDAAITGLTGAGKLVTAAAGNYGAIGMHKRSVAALNETKTVVFTIPTYTPTTLTNESLFLEGWHDGSATYRVKLSSPGGFQSAWIETGGTSGAITVADGTYIVDNDRVTNSRGAKMIGITVYRNSTTSPHPGVGNWTITLTRTGGSSDVCDFWVSSWKLGTVTSPSFVSPDFSHMITSPGSADGVICTGAYSTKSRWTNGSGGTSSYGNVPMNVVADFSSPGPRRDGVQKPDVVAPGYGVAAALSVNAPTSNSYKVLDLVHYMRIGTSQANAHTTGVLALLLQQDGSLTPARAREELAGRAQADEFTGTVPNSLYGYGKLDVLASTSAVTEVVPPQAFGLRGPSPNPSSSGVRFEFRLASSDLESLTGERPVRLGIFDVQGRLVAELNAEPVAGDQQLSWDGRSNRGNQVSSGVYFARLLVGTRATQAIRVNRVQ